MSILAYGPEPVDKLVSVVLLSIIRCSSELTSVMIDVFIHCATKSPIINPVFSTSLNYHISLFTRIMHSRQNVFDALVESQLCTYFALISSM